MVKIFIEIINVSKKRLNLPLDSPYAYLFFSNQANEEVQRDAVSTRAHPHSNHDDLSYNDDPSDVLHTQSHHTNNKIAPVSHLLHVVLVRYVTVMHRAQEVGENLHICAHTALTPLR